MKRVSVLVLSVCLAVAMAAELPRLIEDFEDGDMTNSAKDNGVAKLNGFWLASCDSHGESTMGEPEIVELKGGNKVLHIKGHKGVSRDEKWAWSVVQTCFGGDDKWADLRPSVGMTFRARSDNESAVLVTVEGTVNGKQLGGTGMEHQCQVRLGKQWGEHTVYWDDFTQPSWACPGDNCAGKLEVSHIGHLLWNPATEGADFDVWLDDIKLIYERRQVGN